MKSIPLPHFNERPAGVAIDTIVIHAMHAPQSSDLFGAQSCAQLLDTFQVSAHYLIDRNGDLTQCINDTDRAWHAGQSRMPFAHDTRENVNDFSIGIEVLGLEGAPFEDAQYRSLAALIAELSRKFPIGAIVGHQHIAPGRKTDPGPAFDWRKLELLLGAGRFRFAG